MAASKVVQQLVNVLQELETSITPPVIQFKDKPIFRLTHEEYINQELSMFRKIVTDEILPLESNEINTQRYLMSVGLDYQTATKYRKEIIGGKHLSEVLEVFEDSNNTIFGPIKLQCMITNLCCQKKQIDIKITKKIAELPGGAPGQPIFDLFTAYKKINYDPVEMGDAVVNIDPTIWKQQLEELPNDGFVGNKPTCSFFRAIEDYKKVKDIVHNVDYNNAILDKVNDKTISDKIISGVPGDVVIINGWINELFPADDHDLHVYHRDYDIYNKLNLPAYDFQGAPQNEHIYIVCDGNHYQLITRFMDNSSALVHELTNALGIPVKGLSIQYPLYYNEAGILTKREDLSTKRKLKIIYSETIYTGNEVFPNLSLANKLHVLHRFDIDIPIKIGATGTIIDYSDELDEYIKGRIRE